MDSKENKKVCLYARVSTKLKKNPGSGQQDKATDFRQNPETQLLKLRETCAMRGWLYKEYVERASGSKIDRPILKAMMGELKDYDGVLVVRLDRFGRSTQHLLALLQELKAQGKYFEATEQGIRVDPKNPDILTDFLFRILSAVAELERDMIRERVLDGLDRARAEGKTLGRKKVMDVLNVPQEKIKALLDSGMSVRKMAQELHIKRSTLSGYIQDLKASGKGIAETAAPAPQENAP